MIEILVMLVVVGVLLYLVGLIPMDETIKKAAKAVVLLVVILWLIRLVAPHLPRL